MKLALSSAAALLTVSVVSTNGYSQDKSFKESIIGAWLITSVSDNYDNGQKRDNWGGTVGGQLTFERTGRFSQIIIGAPSPGMKTDDPRKPDAFIVAYYGTYSVDEAKKTITGKLERASYSARAGSTQVWTIQGSGDKLTLVGSERKDQHGTFKPTLEVKRP
jgi:hypothetical protein